MTISAKIIAHSKSAVTDKEIITYELEYPRFIHSELMTHRLFSRNAASSRAIPVSKMIEMVRDNPAMPIHWGKNQQGMQAKEELDDWNKGCVVEAWVSAATHAARLAEDMNKWGAHKQIVNRVLEPFQWMKTVVTSTEWDNWFWLRNHPDAQPEIKRLAEVMLEAKQNSTPTLLQPGDWHVPYYDDGSWRASVYEDNTLEEALAISSSCCAQVSYRKLDDSLEKAKDIFAKLIESKPCHASPCEHQCTPMPQDVSMETDGVTAVHKHLGYMSGNFAGFIQHRQLIEGNVCYDYSPPN